MTRLPRSVLGTVVAVLLIIGPLVLFNMALTDYVARALVAITPTVGLILLLFAMLSALAWLLFSSEVYLLKEPSWGIGYLTGGLRTHRWILGPYRINLVFPQTLFPCPEATPIHHDATPFVCMKECHWCNGVGWIRPKTLKDWYATPETFREYLRQTSSGAIPKETDYAEWMEVNHKPQK